MKNSTSVLTWFFWVAGLIGLSLFLKSLPTSEKGLAILGTVFALHVFFIVRVVGSKK